MLVKRYPKLTSLFTLLSVGYLLLEALLPPDQTSLRRYHISKGELLILTFAVILPYLVIWLIALLGYLRFRFYTQLIRKAKDGHAFHTVSSGVLWLTLWLPVSATFGAAAAGYYHAHNGATATMVILNNYLNVALLLPAFVLIHKGSTQLLAVIKRKESTLPMLLMLGFIAFSALYVFIVLRDPARMAPTGQVPTASYYLTDWLIILTLVVPRLLMWFLGVQAIYNLYLYRKEVKGQLYRLALNRLAWGLAGVVATIVALGCFESISSTLNKLSLSLIVLVVYALLVLMGVGYWLIAKGAKSLQLIEEV